MRVQDKMPSTNINKKQSVELLLPAIIAGSVCSYVFAENNELVPAIQSGFYYRLDGGNDIPLPAFFNTSYIMPIGVRFR